MKKYFTLLFLLASAFVLAEEGKRPYELDWAGRTEDEVPPVADFESGQWTVETAGTIASFEISKEQKIWGEHVGKLTYRRDLENKQNGPTVILRPEKPIPLTQEFDVLSCWIYGNNWAWESDPSTPRVDIDAILRLADGSEQFVRISYVMWMEWFLEYRKLSPAQITLFNKPGTCFNGLRISNAKNEQDRVLYFDNFAVRKEVQNPLTFEPRPKRGIVFPEQISGTNNGPGVLPFPTREETIQPDRSRGEFRNSTEIDPETGAFVLKYAGEDGRLKFSYLPKSGGFSDLRALWNDGQEFTPCAGGGVTELVGTDGKPTPVLRHDHRETRFDGDVLKSRWTVFAAGDVSANVEYRFSMRDKTLRMETSSHDTIRVAKVVYGGLDLAGLSDVKVHPLPYYGYQLYGHNTNRPGVISFRSSDNPATFFLMGNTDWYAGNGSTLFSEYSVNVKAGRAVTNGGVRYNPKTDGTYNPCYERFFLTFSPIFSEVLPNIPNPASPWKHVTGRKFWFAHGAGNRENDKKFFYNVWRHGMREVLVTDHETCWRDGGESFTFRTKAAPGRGGDDGMRDYARYMQDTLGFTYGPYNNFTDFAPVNEYWSPDMISRTSENKLQSAWARCYAPKPARAVEYCAKLSPINQEKFHFSTAYCDVHTSVTPWSRVDYDTRVPGAGTYAAVFYPYGEIMLLQKAAWNGPVYSEGPHHCFYVGLTDGNYAQDQGYDFDNAPWIVDFDLLKMHPLACNFGMGNPGMFYGKKGSNGQTPAETETKIDRFITATAAFGHPGFLNLQYGMQATWRGYFLLQQLQSHYTLANVKEIRYVDANGTQYSTSEALCNGAASRSQLVIQYEDGTVVCANGNSTETMETRVAHDSSFFDVSLPPNSFQGWTHDLKVQSRSALGMDGKRFDYAISPAYIYLDGRGSFQSQPQASGSGAGVCRREDDSHWELIPMNGADMMFRIPDKTPVSAVARNHAGEELGPATLRKSHGYFGVVAVPNAFSYSIEVVDKTQDEKELDAPVSIVPGQTVTVTGESTHEFTAPANTPVGSRLWAQFEGKWVDFGVVPLTQLFVELDPHTGMLNARFRPNLTGPHEFTVQLNDEPPLKSANDGWATKTFTIPPIGNVEGVEETFRITLRSEDLTMTKTYRTVTRATHDFQPFDPARGTSFCHIRDKEPTTDFGETGACFDFPVTSCCEEVTKTGLGAHPPYRTGPGRSYRDFEIRVPDGSNYEFCTSVGKRDGSVTGDGILYQIAVVTNDGTETVLAETVVLNHTWTPLRASLKDYRGQTVRLRLIVDCGRINDTSGDWAIWSDFELRTEDKIFRRTFLR